MTLNKEPKLNQTIHWLYPQQKGKTSTLTRTKTKIEKSYTKLEIWYGYREV